VIVGRCVLGIADLRPVKEEAGGHDGTAEVIDEEDTRDHSTGTHAWTDTADNIRECEVVSVYGFGLQESVSCERAGMAFAG
jgi:hypothetical protein